MMKIAKQTTRKQKTVKNSKPNHKYDDKIILTFNWKDDSKTVTLDEADTADGAAGKDTEAGEVFRISDSKSSHLDYLSPYRKHHHSCIWVVFFVWL